jgi:uncharacterized protein (TIGR02231 family)
MLDAPITDVLVYRNGVKIIRTGAITISQDAPTVILKNLPVAIDNSTIKVTGKGNGPGKITGMSIEEIHGTEIPQAEIAELEKEIAQLRAKERVLVETLEFLAKYKASILDMQDTFLEDFPFAIPDEKAVQYIAGLSQQVDPEPGSSAMAFIEQASGTADAVIQHIERMTAELTTLRAQIDAETNRFSALQQKAGVHVSKQAVIAISVPEEAEFTFTIQYVLNAGYWEPIYDVFLDDESVQVTIKLLAALVNNTGEDWVDVQLGFSTATLKPIRVIEPSPWVLRERRVVYPASTMSYGVEGGGMPMVHAMAKAMAPGRPIAAAMAPAPPQPMERQQAEIGGSVLATQTFTMTDRMSIRPGNWRNNVVLLEMELPGRSEYFYTTERATLVAQTVIKNGDLQLLQGTAKVYAGEAYICETTMNAVLPAEEFTLGTRESHDLKIAKKLVSRSTDKGGMAKGRVIKHYRYEITVENLAGATNDLVLVDRMPFSDSELVKVQAIGDIKPTPVENRLGILKWRIPLGSKDKKFTIAYDYEVSYDKGVILDTSLP